jgi:small GTP-binding protein
VRKKETKIVIFGSYNSGKTTTLENLCEKKAIVEYKGSTIALDYGNTIYQQEKVHLFSTPGQERFQFMRDILSRGLDGAIVVVDNSQGVTEMDLRIMYTLANSQVPFVVFANKQDLDQEELYVDGLDPIVVPTIACDSIGIGEGLQILLEIIRGV